MAPPRGALLHAHAPRPRTHAVSPHLALPRLRLAPCGLARAGSPQQQTTGLHPRRAAPLPYPCVPRPRIGVLPPAAAARLAARADGAPAQRLPPLPWPPPAACLLCLGRCRDGSAHRLVSLEPGLIFDRRSRAVVRPHGAPRSHHVLPCALPACTLARFRPQCTRHRLCKGVRIRLGLAARLGRVLFGLYLSATALGQLICRALYRRRRLGLRRLLSRPRDAHFVVGMLFGLRLTPLRLALAFFCFGLQTMRLCLRLPRSGLLLVRSSTRVPSPRASPRPVGPARFCCFRLCESHRLHRFARGELLAQGLRGIVQRRALDSSRPQSGRLRLGPHGARNRLCERCRIRPRLGHSRRSQQRPSPWPPWPRLRDAQQAIRGDERCASTRRILLRLDRPVRHCSAASMYA